MVIDAHLKNVNCVNYMKKKRKKHCHNNKRQNRNTSHTNTWLLTFALHMKGGGFEIKTVLIIVYFTGNLSFNNLYTFCHLSSNSFM